MQIEPGQNLLHYRIVAKVGEGGMGEVWRATDTELGRDVAIKVLPATLASDGERLARFEREARLLGSLNHPQIATIHGLHEARIGDHSIRLLVMELVEGEDLTLLVERRVSFERAIEIAPDGDAILIPSPLQEEARLDRITVLVNWLDEVERVVPADR